MRLLTVPALERPWPLASALAVLLSLGSCTDLPPAATGTGSIGTISLVLADQHIAHVRLTPDRPFAPGTLLYSHNPQGIPTTLTVGPQHIAGNLVTTITAGDPQPDDAVTAVPLPYDPSKPPPPAPLPFTPPERRPLVNWDAHPTDDAPAPAPGSDRRQRF